MTDGSNWVIHHMNIRFVKTGIFKIVVVFVPFTISWLISVCDRTVQDALTASACFVKL